jgi:hypothetical protein
LRPPLGSALGPYLHGAINKNNLKKKKKKKKKLVQENLMISKNGRFHLKNEVFYYGVPKLKITV